jgi:hypothetical protein
VPRIGRVRGLQAYSGLIDVTTANYHREVTSAGRAAWSGSLALAVLECRGLVSVPMSSGAVVINCVYSPSTGENTPIGHFYKSRLKWPFPR